MDNNSPRPSTSASSATTATSTAVENEEQSMTSRLRSKLALRLTKKASKLNLLHHSPMLSVIPPTAVDSPSRASFSSSTQTIDTPFTPPHSDSASFLSPPKMSLSKDQTYHNSLSKKSSQSIFREKSHNASSSALSTLSIGSIGSYATSIGGRSNVFSGATSGRRKREQAVSAVTRKKVNGVLSVASSHPAVASRTSCPVPI